MIISRTPYRVSFLGGGTDYAEWYREHGGAVLTSSIDKYCYLSVRWLPQFFAYQHRISWSKIELCGKVEEIEHPAVRAVLQYLGVERGIEIHHAGDLPARSGLGSSSAFTVGLLNALHALHGRMSLRRSLAAEAVHVERDLMGEAVGVQDQIECAHGGLNLLEIDRDGAWRVQPVVIAPERLRAHEAHCLLYFTGISRTASELARAQVAAIGGKTGAMKDLAALVREGLAALSDGAPLAEFGRLLDESWRIKKSLASGISTEGIDAMYACARGHGAIGGKLLGAGGGGFLLLFARPEDQGRLRHALREVLEIPFRFEAEGSRIVYASG